jgi:hypothetical protein
MHWKLTALNNNYTNAPDSQSLVLRHTRKPVLSTYMKMAEELRSYIKTQSETKHVLQISQLDFYYYLFFTLCIVCITHSLVYCGIYWCITCSFFCTYNFYWWHNYQHTCRSCVSLQWPSTFHVLLVL